MPLLIPVPYNFLYENIWNVMKIPDTNADFMSLNSDKDALVGGKEA